LLLADVQADLRREMVKCSKCGKRLRINIPKCPSCGSKVAEVATKTFVYTIAVVVLLAVIACLAVARYGGPACKTIEIEELKPYTETEPYTLNEDVSKPIRYAIDSANSYLDAAGYDYHTIGKIRLKNIDTIAGIFSIKGTFTEKGKNSTSTITHEIDAGETKLYYFDYNQKDNGKKSDFTYEVLSPTTSETKSSTRYREVTKYKPEKVMKTFC
jgi:hypothetical protein